MRFPFVSRLRLEMAERETVLLQQQIEDLKAANGKLMELAELTAEIRVEREQKAEDDTPHATKPRRLFGKDVVTRANAAAAEKAAKSGKPGK
jgi:hypothetical protein